MKASAGKTTAMLAKETTWVKRAKSTKVRKRQGGKTVNIRAPTDPPKFKAYMSINIRVGRGLRTKHNFDTVIGNGLDFLREQVDPEACILPREMSKLGEWGMIKEKSDIPEFQVAAKKSFPSFRTSMPSLVFHTKMDDPSGDHASWGSVKIHSRF